MQSVILERPAENGPFGAKGIGEMTANAPIPAIANAIYDACGVRLESMPFTPEKVLRGLDELRGLMVAQPLRDGGRLGRGARAPLRRSSATSPTRDC